MLCSLIVVFALLACVFAEKNLRQAARAAPVVELTKAHLSFKADYESRSQVRGLVDINGEAETETEAVTETEASAVVALTAPNDAYRFTGSVYQIETDTLFCEGENGPAAYTKLSYKLGVCHTHAKPRPPQAKSSMFYLKLDQNTNTYHVRAQYYSDPKCTAEKFRTDSEFNAFSSCPHGVSTNWGSKFAPMIGIVQSFYYGSECTEDPLSPQQAVFTQVTTPFGICQDENSGGSHLMSDCYVDQGKVYVNGLGFDQKNCSGPSTPIADFAVGDVCTVSRNSFTVAECRRP